MAQVTWLEPAVADLAEVAQYIAIENPAAASRVVARILKHVGQLADHPLSGSVPPELSRTLKYRQIVEPPCRIFYRVESNEVFVLHVLRFESLLRLSRLEDES